MKKKLLSTQQTAKQLNVSRQTLCNWNLPCKVKIGGKMYYKQRDIEKIKETGMDIFLAWFYENKKQCQSALDHMAAEINQTLSMAMTMEDVDTIYRTYFLCSDQWLELMSLEHCETVSIVEVKAENEYQDIAFWGNEENATIEDLQAALAKVAATDLFVIRYNVLPREIFSALYERFLINQLIIDVVKDEYVRSIYLNRQSVLADCLFANAI